MRFLGNIATSAIAFASLAIAQNPLGFTSVPTAVRAGQGAVIGYTAQDLSEAVTITLRKGDPNKLDTIQTLTSDATGGNYTWIPSKSLENAGDYALQIQQGNEINYSGAIALSGADPAAVSSAQAVTASMLSLGAGLTSSYIQASSISSIQSAIASYNSSLQNLTAPVTSSASLSAQPSAGTGVGETLPRNQTMVAPTLTSTQTNTANSPGRGSPTGSAPAASSSGAAAHAIDAVTKSSPLALVLAVVVGLIL